MAGTVLCLLGPTASGKSAAALELAECAPIEIITLDSAQVFCGMDIGTAKPTDAERAVCPHHLIDILSPVEAYSAARFLEDCQRLVVEIQRRGRIPVIVGGTMLYFKALREGLSPLPEANQGVREMLRTEAQSLGWPALHARLAALDPETAQRLHQTDSQRIERALEIVTLTGLPLRELHKQTAPPPPFKLVPLALVPSDRSVLHARIEARFDVMLNAGLVDEMAQLCQQYPLHEALASVRCVGYRQVWEFLQGQARYAEMRARGVFATRQLAKRQLTWLRNTPGLRVVDCLSSDAKQQLVDLALRVIEGEMLPEGGKAFDW